MSLSFVQCCAVVRDRDLLQLAMVLQEHLRLLLCRLLLGLWGYVLLQLGLSCGLFCVLVDHKAITSQMSQITALVVDILLELLRANVSISADSDRPDEQSTVVLLVFLGGRAVLYPATGGFGRRHALLASQLMLF